MNIKQLMLITVFISSAIAIGMDNNQSYWGRFRQNINNSWNSFSSRMRNHIDKNELIYYNEKNNSNALRKERLKLDEEMYNQRYKKNLMRLSSALTEANLAYSELDTNQARARENTRHQKRHLARTAQRINDEKRKSKQLRKISNNLQGEYYRSQETLLKTQPIILKNRLKRSYKSMNQFE